MNTLHNYDPVVRAIHVASLAHAEQLDKNRLNYMGHLARVAWAVTRDPIDLDPIIVAWLHDTLEDSALLAEDLLEAAGFSAEIVDAVVALTRGRDESYDDYIIRVRANRLAAIVKEADLRDNLDEQRLDAIDDLPTRKRLTAKYTRALELLETP